MNIVLWILQILLGLLFVFAGSMKFIMSADEMAQSMPVALPIWFIHFIGVCEILGGIGLVVPWLTGIKRSLTPLAASLLIIIMAGATAISAMVLPATAIMPFVVGILLFFVARGRYKAVAESVR
jgi:uncharacterized membrane protein YphA (DoxX/SURF4 family)